MTRSGAPARPRDARPGGGRSPATALGLAALLCGGALPGVPDEVRAQAREVEVAEVELRGLDLLDPPIRIRRPLPLRPGVPLTRERELATVEVVEEALGERGRPYALVEVSTEGLEAGRAVVRVEVVDVGPEVRFGPVTVEAVPPLRSEMIRERVAWEPGDLFRPSRAQLTRERLVRLPAVRNAVVVPVGAAAGDTVVPTVVSVVAHDDLRGPELRGTISSLRCLEVAGFWRDRFVAGGPRTLSLGAGVGNLFADPLGGRFPCTGAGEGETAAMDHFVRGEVGLPGVGGPDLDLTLGGFHRRESSPRVDVLQGFGVEVALRRYVERSWTVGLSYRFERMEVRGAGFFFCATFGACAREDIEALARPRRQAPLEGRLAWMPPRTREIVELEMRPSGTGAPEPPTPGPPGAPGEPPAPAPGASPEAAPLHLDLLAPRWRPWANVLFTAAGRATGSEHRYGRVALEAGVRRTLGRRWEMAGRGRTGALLAPDEGLPPGLRFLTGGPGAVRGAGPNLLGPRVLVADPAEADALGCVVEEGGCPPGIVPHPDLVRVRARGGGFLLEANMELRVRSGPRILLAGFVDGAFLGGEGTGFRNGGGGIDREWTVTPGIGVSVRTPVGPLRVDLGYDPRGPRALPLLTEGPDGDLLHLGEVSWRPHTYDRPGPLREFVRRLQLSVGMGPPF